MTRSLRATRLSAALLIACASHGQASTSSSAGTPTGKLHCQARYSSQTVTLEAAPTTAPYAVQAVAVGKRFAFKAVVLQRGDQVDSITLSTYDTDLPEAPVMLHQVVYTPPFQGNEQLPSLTGWQRVYASGLGREMRFGCAWQALAPLKEPTP